MKPSFSFKVFDSYNKINLVSTKAWGSINPFTSYWAIKRIAEAIDSSERENELANRLVFAEQIHGGSVHVCQPGDGGSIRLSSDALISNVRRQILGIYTADCLPILLFEPKKEVIGAIHAGYKGLGQGVIYNTIEQLVVNFGCSPSDVLVGLGPFIHACCYEIREELLVALEKLDWLPYVKKNSDRLFLDLNEIVQFQLRDCGILSSQIESLGLCNSCRSDLFFSARKRTHHDERGASIISLISLSEKFFP